jgi:hypothetical protein
VYGEIGVIILEAKKYIRFEAENTLCLIRLWLLATVGRKWNLVKQKIKTMTSPTLLLHCTIKKPKSDETLSNKERVGYVLTLSKNI